MNKENNKEYKMREDGTAGVPSSLYFLRINWFYDSFYTTVIENNIIANELFKLNIIPYKPNYSVTIAYSLQKFCIKWCTDYAAGNFDSITGIEIS